MFSPVSRVPFIDGWVLQPIIHPLTFLISIIVADREISSSMTRTYHRQTMVIEVEISSSLQSSLRFSSSSEITHRLIGERRDRVSSGACSLLVFSGVRKTYSTASSLERPHLGFCMMDTSWGFEEEVEKEGGRERRRE